MPSGYYKLCKGGCEPGQQGEAKPGCCTREERKTVSSPRDIQWREWRKSQQEEGSEWGGPERRIKSVAMVLTFSFHIFLTLSLELKTVQKSVFKKI